MRIKKSAASPHTSGRLVVLLAQTGVPADMASSAGKPNPSEKLGKRSASAAAKSAGISFSGRKPVKNISCKRRRFCHQSHFVIKWIWFSRNHQRTFSSIFSIHFKSGNCSRNVLCSRHTPDTRKMDLQNALYIPQFFRIW